MKKLLVLYQKMEHAKELSPFLEENLKGEAEVVSAKMADLVFYLASGQIKAKINGEDVSNFNLVWLRTVGQEFFPSAKTLAAILENLRIPYLDAMWGQGGGGENKLTDLAKLAIANLPITPSFFCTHERILAEAQKIAAEFSFPLIAKNIWKDKGKGVFLLQKMPDFEELFNKTEETNQFLFQKFYPNDGDYRILVLGYQVKTWEKRIRKADAFRNNASLGGDEEFYPPENIPPELAQISIQGAKTLNLQAAGVDILTDSKTGKNWILEVNHSPGFTYEGEYAPEPGAAAEYIKSAIREEKLV